MRLKGLCAGILATACLSAASWADVKLPAIFGDHMVLQQDSKLPVWGWADPGEAVTVSAAGQKAAATAGQDGKWTVKLEAIKVTDQPIELTVAGKNTLTLKDVLVGDVWVCSGQSNMEFALANAHNAATEVTQANYPKIRLFKVAKKIAFEPQADCQGKWEVCTPESARGFSAVGYFFGKELHQTFGKPIGLVGTYWGGTPAQAWTSLSGLQSQPSLDCFIDGFNRVQNNLAKIKEQYEKEILPKWQQAYDRWKADAQAQRKNNKNATPSRPPLKPSDPTQSPHIPTVLNNGMIAPLIPYAIKGAIWYQGESNAGNPIYRTLFPAMIADWRKSWGQGDFPFLFVQLANFAPGGGSWASLREAQLMTLSLPKTGMAVAIDVGQANDIHPRDKMDVGRRLALAARHIAYGQDLVYSGPIYKSMKVEGDKIRLAFDHVGGGLTIAAAPSTQPNVPPASPASSLKGFTIAGADKQFLPAQAKIEGDSVVIWSEQVQQPVAVRYGWESNPQVNLYNKEHLPASPFRTDNWEPTAPAKK